MRGPLFDIYDSNWKIHSRNIGIEPQYIAKNAVVKNSLITGGAKVEGTVVNSIIGSKVHIKKGAVVKDSVIFSGTTIGENSIINYSIIDENVTIGKNATVGVNKEFSTGISVVGRDTVIPDDEVIKEMKKDYLKTMEEK